MATRQRNWQIKRKAEGRCSSCGLAVIYQSERCFRHHLLRVLSREGLSLTKKRPPPKNIELRDKLISFLHGRYVVTRSLGVPPEESPMWLDVAFAPIKNAEEKFAKVIRSIDRKAIRAYAHDKLQVTNDERPDHN